MRKMLPLGTSMGMGMGMGILPPPRLGHWVGVTHVCRRGTSAGGPAPSGTKVTLVRGSGRQLGDDKQVHWVEEKIQFTGQIARGGCLGRTKQHKSNIKVVITVYNVVIVYIG